MKFKRCISLLMLISVMFSLCTFSVYADDSLNLPVSDFDYSATLRPIGGGSGAENITSSVSFSPSVNTPFGDGVSFKIPYKYAAAGVESTIKFNLNDSSKINVNDRYNIKFNYYIPSADTLDYVDFNVSLDIYDGFGQHYDSVTIYEFNSAYIDETVSVDVDFSLDKDSVPTSGGYRCELNIYTLFYSNTNVEIIDSYTLYMSKNISLTNNDDNSGWFQKIIDAITAIPQKLGNFFTQLGNKIGGFFSDLTDSIGNWFTELWNNIKEAFDKVGDWFTELGDKLGNWFTDLWNNIKDAFDKVGEWFKELGENIKQWFIDLGDKIGEFFTMLKNYILYFQHPVTVGPDGVLVGPDGKPVYTNPFDSVIDEVEKTVNEWISKIQSFIDSIDKNADDVSEWIKTGSGMITKLFSGVPLLLTLAGFGIAFIVIRKVVGR